MPLEIKYYVQYRDKSTDWRTKDDYYYSGYLNRASALIEGAKKIKEELITSFKHTPSSGDREYRIIEVTSLSLIKVVKE